MRPMALLAVAALASACTVQPLTPTVAPTQTLPAVGLVVATFTLAAATRTPAAAPETPVLEPAADVSPPASPTAEAAPAAVAQPPALAPTDTPVPASPSPLPAPSETPGVESAAPAPDDVAAGEQYAIDQINAQRAAAGVPLLARDETLMGIARARVADMIARGYTGHLDPVTGAAMAPALIRAAGYTSPYLGENWYGSIKGPPTIVDVAMAWFMTDPPHARNILSPNFVAVGIGIGYNGRQWLLIQNFVGPNT